MELTRNAYIAIFAAITLVAAGVVVFAVLSKNDDAEVLLDEKGIKIEYLGGDQYRFSATQFDTVQWILYPENSVVNVGSSTEHIWTVSLADHDVYFFSLSAKTGMTEYYFMYYVDTVGKKAGQWMPT
jgi:hypothetical protein